MTSHSKSFRWRWRYIFGVMLLFMDGFLGGNIIMQALWLGIGFGIVDLIEEKRNK